MWPLALVYDPLMRGLERRWGSGWREELLAPLGGSVLEIGAGTGANVPFYPRAVERVTLSEPDRAMRWQLERRLARSPLAARASVLPAAVDELTGTFDAVVATLVLCTVPDLERAARSLFALVRPGGALVFLEHVAADQDPSALAWQERLDPVWRRVAGGCRLARRSDRALVSAGFALEGVTRFEIPRAAAIVKTIVRGTARRPAAGP